MNYYEQPRVSDALIKMAYQSAAPVLGALLGGGAGFGLGMLDKKNENTKLYSALAGALLGGLAGIGYDKSNSATGTLFDIPIDSTLALPIDSNLML